MKISIANKWDVIGGAARAAWRLVSKLDSLGHEVNYYVNEKTSKYEYVKVIDSFARGEFEEGDIQSNYINCNRTAVSNTFFSYSFADITDDAIEKITNADIVNLHWIEKFFSPNTLSKIASSGVPIVWTLHDERPYTGGCHYTAGCMQYAFNYCETCIQLKRDRNLLASSVLKEKISALDGCNLTVVSPSKWLGRAAKKSQLFKKYRVEIIPNSLEIDVYKPTDKRLARRNLGLPQESFLILFGAQNAKEERKGYKELVEAIHYFCNLKLPLSGKQVQILAFGESTDESQNLPIDVTQLGTIKDDKQLAEIYSAADVFVIPSKEDNLPNTILESMACGTPVIGFNIGGVGDLVVPGETGYLASIFSPKALAHSLLKAFQNPEDLEKYSVKCVDESRRTLNQNIQAERYLTLFRELSKSLCN